MLASRLNFENFCSRWAEQLYGQHVCTYTGLLLRGEGVGRLVYTLEFLIEEVSAPMLIDIRKRFLSFRMLLCSM
jgi:hypothetical protein